MSRVAEDVGFDGVLFGDMKTDSLLAVGTAATSTSGIDVGTNIAIAFARSPMMLAVTANDVQLVSAGRVRLGLGTQIRAHIVRRFSMPWSSPVERMRDYVLAVRSIWDAWDNGTPLDHRGPFYQHTLMS